MLCSLFVGITLLINCQSLNNGVARTPPMGWSSWNLYHRNFTEQDFENAINAFTTTPMQKMGYEYINVDGGWWWSVDNAVHRNSTGYAYVDPKKYPDGIQSLIDKIHSKGLKYGHYTDAGTAACSGDKQMSEHYMTQDIELFISWGIDMIKVDGCNVQGNDTEIIFKWRDMLNATNREVLFSDCHNQCENDPKKKNFSPWKDWCIDLANMWRVSGDIKAEWERILYTHDCTNGLGKYAQPGAWNDPDFLEVDIGDFKYDGTKKSLLMNQAHFSLWSVISAPLILGLDLSKMSNEILDIITNKYAIDINQNYLNNAGDVITEFNISQQFRKEYEKQVKENKNMTTLYYKPLPNKIGDAAILFLNRDNKTSYEVSVDFNQLPLSKDNNSPLECTTINVWTDNNSQMINFNATLPPQSVKYLLLNNCKETGSF